MKNLYIYIFIQPPRIKSSEKFYTKEKGTTYIQKSIVFYIYHANLFEICLSVVIEPNS